MQRKIILDYQFIRLARGYAYNTVRKADIGGIWHQAHRFVHRK